MIGSRDPVDPVVETRRTVLRPLMVSDLEHAQSLLCDPDVMQYIADPLTPDEVARGMHLWTRRGAGNRLGIWAVFDRVTGEALGDGLLTPVPIEQEDTDWESLRPDNFPSGPIEVGYLLKPDAWGRGIATEVCTGLVEFAFRTAGLEDVFATTEPENTASQHVLRKCGLEPLGKRRAYASDDVEWFKITRASWLARQASHQ